jgi:hypothetical protein
MYPTEIIDVGRDFTGERAAATKMPLSAVLIYTGLRENTGTP